MGPCQCLLPSAKRQTQSKEMDRRKECVGRTLHKGTNSVVRAIHLDIRVGGGEGEIAHAPRYSGTASLTLRGSAGTGLGFAGTAIGIRLGLGMGLGATGTSATFGATTTRVRLRMVFRTVLMYLFD